MITSPLEFEGLIQNSPDPIFAVNSRRRLVFMNPACAELLDMEPAEVIGQQCKAHTLTEPAVLSTRLARCCPPPEALSGTPTVTSTLLVSREGSRTWRSVQWLPVTGIDGAVAVVIGRIGPPSDAEKPAPDNEPIQATLARLRKQLFDRFGIDHLVATTPSMLRALEQAKLASQSLCPVLLCGEPGTGKEHLARVIHTQSALGPQAFVALDCGGLPHETLDRLLGTGPAAVPPGTLYLNNPHRLPRDLQNRLLSPEHPGEMRLMAGGHIDWSSAVETGTLQAELYFRLSTLVIHLPALRDRREDLPHLVQHFIELANASSDNSITEFSNEVRELVENYPWPGNLDELQEAINQAHSRCREPTLERKHFAMALRSAVERAQTPSAVPERLLPLDELLEQAERRLIELALRQARGNISKAAARLAISRPRLYRRLEQFGIVEGGTISENAESQTPEQGST
jgi:transcriptional regulator with PAS, ATPase and Fis domain